MAVVLPAPVRCDGYALAGPHHDRRAHARALAGVALDDLFDLKQVGQAALPLLFLQPGVLVKGVDAFFQDVVEQARVGEDQEGLAHVADPDQIVEYLDVVLLQAEILRHAVKNVAAVLSPLLRVEFQSPLS